MITYFLTTTSTEQEWNDRNSSWCIVAIFGKVSYNEVMRWSLRLLWVVGAWLVAAMTFGAELLMQNGSILNGPNGARLSIVTSPNTTFGYSVSTAHPNRVAEDFVVTDPFWVINEVELAAFLQGNNSSLVTSVNLFIFHGHNPNDARLVYSLLGRKPSSYEPVGYRVSSTNLSDRTRHCLRLIVSLPYGLALPAGRYWIAYSLSGTGVNNYLVPQVMAGQEQPIPGNAHTSTQGGAFKLASWGGNPINTAKTPLVLRGERFQEAAIASTDFETGTVGWKVAKLSSTLTDPPTVLGSYNPSWPVDGDAGNGIQFTDVDSGIAYWSAPPRFLGNQSEAYRGYLRYSYFATSPNPDLDVADVLLVGSSLTLVADHPSPKGNWRQGRIPLQPGFWKVLGGAQATEEQIKSVLADLDALYIRAEYDSGPDSYRLDHVVVASNHRATSLIRNPSFEFPAKADFQSFGNGKYVDGEWKVHNATVAVNIVSNAYAGGGVDWHDTPFGNQFAYIGGDLKDGEIRQGVRLQPAQIYELSWYQAAFASGTTSGEVKVSLLTSNNLVHIPAQSFAVNPGGAFERKSITFQVGYTSLFWLSFAASPQFAAIVDNIELAPVGAISGTVKFLGSILREEGQPVTVIMKTDNEIITREMLLDAGGTFEIAAPHGGAVTVWVKGPKSLAKSEKVTLNFGVTQAAYELATGDCNNDNRVNLDDYLIILINLGRTAGEPGYDGRADLDGNGYVGTDDYLLFNASYGLSGVERPE